MTTRTNKPKPRIRLTPARIGAFKKLARKIDAEEQQEIQALGRAIFRRHLKAAKRVRGPARPGKTAGSKSTGRRAKMDRYAKGARL